MLEGASIDIVSKKINSMANENTRLNTQLLEIEREKMFLEVDGENLKLLISNISKFLAKFDKIDISEKQNFIKTIIKEVVWDSTSNDGEDEITIKFLE